MKKYMKEYIEEIDVLLKKKEKINDKTISEHLIKISFFQHERLIHLLVTLFYALFVFIFLAFSIWITYQFLVVELILLVFLGFYIKHYFFLENGVQYMYRQYDKMRALRIENK